MNKTMLSVALLLLSAVCCLGQKGEYDPVHEISLWGGFSPDSSTIVEGTARTPDVRAGIVSLRYTRRFAPNKNLRLAYIADATPLVVLSYPLLGAPAGTRQTAYGFGGSPIGLKIIFRPKNKIQPAVEVAPGFLYFNKPVPGPDSKNFAFTGTIGASVDINLSEKRMFTLGYKYYHVSNGNRGLENPGIDNNVFFVGYRLFRKHSCSVEDC